MPGFTDVLHVVSMGLVPPLTHRASLLPSMRHPAPQQYVSFWHVSTVAFGSHGPPSVLQMPPDIPLGAFTQIWFIGHGMLELHGTSAMPPLPPAPPPPVVTMPPPWPVVVKIPVVLMLPPAPGPAPVVLPPPKRDDWPDEHAANVPAAATPTTIACRRQRT
jgi:hypothetical protein